MTKKEREEGGTDHKVRVVYLLIPTSVWGLDPNMPLYTVGLENVILLVARVDLGSGNISFPVEFEHKIAESSATSK